MLNLHPLVTSTRRLAGLCLLVLALMLPAGLAFDPISGQAQAQDVSPEHLRLGARLAELTGANQFYVSALNAQRRDIIRALAATNPDIADTITEVTDLAYIDMAETTGPLFEQIAGVFASAYSQEDLMVMVAFFESEVGARYLETRRSTDEGVLQATIGWGDEISVDFLARVRALLLERGIEL